MVTLMLAVVSGAGAWSWHHGRYDGQSLAVTVVAAVLVAVLAAWHADDKCDEAAGR
jgi:hypothetical protein